MKPKSLVYCMAVGLLLGSWSTAKADMFATDWDVASGASSLYRLNTSTGAATLIGSTGVSRLVGLAEDSGGTLYSVNESDTGPSSNLYTINPTTGAATLVGSLGVKVAEGDLAIDPATGNLYVANALTDQLLQVNKGTGNATIIGGFGAAGRDVSGMDFISGTLYGLALKDANPDTLVTIDTGTGAATTVGNTGTNFGVIAALGVDPLTGQALIGGPTSTFGSDNTLWSLNTTTGAATFDTAITGITFSLSGLAPIITPAAVPEPGSVAMLLGMGLTGAGFLFKKRRR